MSRSMPGRVKRMAGLAAAEALAAARDRPAPACARCGRPFGLRVEWQHLGPKSEGGTLTAPVHPICHRTIHATLTNHDPARVYANPETLRAYPAIARFVAWVADKLADFHAPVRRGR